MSEDIHQRADKLGGVLNAAGVTRLRMACLLWKRGNPCFPPLCALHPRRKCCNVLPRSLLGLKPLLPLLPIPIYNPLLKSEQSRFFRRVSFYKRCPDLYVDTIIFFKKQRSHDLKFFKTKVMLTFRSLGSSGNL